MNVSGHDPFTTSTHHNQAEANMSWILLLLLLVLLLAALPAWPYSRGWGYYPSGGLALLLIILLLIVLL